MPRSIRDSVVVITGASSGIGRAIALALAARAGNIVATSRDREALAGLARECEAAGGHVLTLAADVNDEDAVQDVARAAVEQFGRLDAWINNAAVTLYGRFEETPAADYRRVIETNLFGYIHGARAAIPWFREQGDGVLVNVSSLAGRIAQPFTSAYVASKFAVIGLSESLRQELRDAPGIHVVTVLLPSVDTPLFRHGANYTGWTPKPLGRAHDPHRIARAIIGAIAHPRREVVPDATARAALLAQRLAPAAVERAAAVLVPRRHFLERHAEAGAGNLYAPADGHDVRGGWGPRPRRNGNGWLALAGLAGLGIGFGLGRLRGQRG